MGPQRLGLHGFGGRKRGMGAVSVGPGEHWEWLRLRPSGLRRCGAALARAMVALTGRSRRASRSLRPALLMVKLRRVVLKFQVRVTGFLVTFLPEVMSRIQKGAQPQIHGRNSQPDCGRAMEGGISVQDRGTLVQKSLKQLPMSCVWLSRSELLWCSWLTRPPHTRKIPSSSLGRSTRTHLFDLGALFFDI
jgi:hypothetical protein